ncbi:hypothetical protein FRC10_010984 [Ceratobasidium sp. 414]|nr:hypothetical protein FRC10_010984 [Ceratobasidium sp. 414]
MSDNPNIFNTLEIRPWETPRLLNSKPIVNGPCYGASFPMGLNWLNFGRSGNIRIKAYTQADPDRGSTVHLDASGDTILYSAGCTWLNVYRDDRDFQFGTFSTVGKEGDYPCWTSHISFEEPYAVVPRVVVWFQELDFAKAHTSRLKASAEDVTTTGFTLKLYTWLGTKVYKAVVTWIAHPSNRSNITSGTFDTTELPTRGRAQLENKKSITFDKGFSRPPRVYAALNGLDICASSDLRIKVLVKDLTTQSMTLHLDSWYDTTQFMAKADYIAIGDY